jgi:reactive chlorine resistance protein C
MERHVHKLQGLGAGVVRYGLVGILLLYGLLKFTKFEAEGIQPYLVHSPLMSWMNALFDVRGASAIIGVIEVALAVGILSWRWAPRLSGLASLGAVGMFLVTLSFLFTTPEHAPWTQAGGLAGGFLLKDLILLGASLTTAAEAFGAASRAGQARVSTTC